MRIAGFLISAMIFSAFDGYADSPQFSSAPLLLFEVDDASTPVMPIPPDPAGVPNRGVAIYRGEYFSSFGVDELTRSDAWYIALGQIDRHHSCFERVTQIVSAIADKQDRRIIRIDLPGLFGEVGLCSREIADIVVRNESDEEEFALLVLYAGSLEYRRMAVDATLYRWGLRATRSISAGEALSSESVERSAYSGRDLFYTDSIDWFVSRRAISRGEIIDRSILEKDTLVERRRKVRVYIRKNSAVVEVDGIALGNGGYGDEIRVRTDIAARIMYGVITGRGMVYVDIS